MRMEKLALALLLLTSVACKVDWKDMTMIEEDYKGEKELRFFTGGISLTFKSDGKVSQTVNVVPDFTSGSTIVGYKTKGFDWGIDCKGQDDDKCWIDDKTVNPDKFRGNDYEYFDARTVGVFPDDADFTDEKVSETLGFKVRMLSNPEKALPFGSNGVLGLAPKSDFYDYVTNNFNFDTDQKYIETGVIVFSQNGLNKEAMEGKTEGTFDNSNVFMNGHNKDKVNSTIGLNTVAALKTDNLNFWGVDKFTLALGDGTKFTNEFNTVCFAPHFDGTFSIVEDTKTPTGVYDKFIAAADAMIKDSDFSKVSKLQASLAVNEGGKDTLKIMFRPEEFIISAADSKGTYTVLKDTTDNVAKMGCAGADLIIGRLFFQRNYVIFRRDLKDANAGTIAITQYLPLDKITHAERNVLLGFGLFMVALILIALVVRCTGGKGGDSGDEDDEEGYAKV